MGTENIIQIDSPDDPRIAPYLNLKERELAREGGRFIAEAGMVVKRLLKSRYAVESVLAAEKRAPELASLMPAGIPLFVGSTDLVNRIVGFKFHSGVMACGLRGISPQLDDLSDLRGEKSFTLVVCPEISNTENLGSMIRISAAFGATALVLGEHCCDPFFRQSIRVSMGTVFYIPIIRSQELLADLRSLKSKYGFELVATVLDEKAESLATIKRSCRIALLFGNEAQGISEDYLRLCDRQVTIPMQYGTDSLNVAVAAGIFLYHFTQFTGR
jgi:tRNA G18 (ribose-2'-O)-methylase SpoU